jgi:hypothetical protein
MLEYTSAARSAALPAIPHEEWAYPSHYHENAAGILVMQMRSSTVLGHTQARLRGGTLGAVTAPVKDAGQTGRGTHARLFGAARTPPEGGAEPPRP